MNQIKFSHDYYKLKGMLKDPNFNEVELLHVFIEGKPEKYCLGCMGALK
jgi:hypothetical protein